MYVRRRGQTHWIPRLVRLLILIALLWTSLRFILKFTQANNSRIISPLADNYTPAPHANIFSFFKPTKDPEKLEAKIKELIGNRWNNYSIYIVDYNSKLSIGLNESTIYAAASVNKIPILAALYAEVQKGTISLDRIITVQAKDMQDYGTGSIRYDEPGSTYSIKTLARLMMQKSDNTAAFLLGTHIVGLDTIQSYADGWGMTQTNMEKNETSNKDMAILLEKIYSKKITTPALSSEMLDFLKDSDFEDRIPGMLPKDVTVYHKIGTGVGAVHDVGIVEKGNTRYYVGFFTSDITDEEQAATLVSEISKAIYEFMSGN